jgi:hypothetical protein
MAMQRPPLTSQENAEQIELIIDVYDRSTSTVLHQAIRESPADLSPLSVLTVECWFSIRGGIYASERCALECRGWVGRITQKACAPERRVLAPARHLVQFARFRFAARWLQQKALPQAHGLRGQKPVFSSLTIHFLVTHTISLSSSRLYFTFTCTAR